MLEDDHLALVSLEQQRVITSYSIHYTKLYDSADLAPSNLTRHTSALDVSNETPEGNYMHYGVREFGMSAIMNGVALHGGFIPYGGTFLMFV